MIKKVFGKTFLWLLILFGGYFFLHSENVKKEEELATKEGLTEEEYLESQEKEMVELFEGLEEENISFSEKSKGRGSEEEEIITQKVPSFLIRQFSKEEKETFIEYAKTENYIIEGSVAQNGSMELELTEKQKEEVLELIKDFR